jgi:threonine/homoserine/homoserine lactone efflux protein
METHSLLPVIGVLVAAAITPGPNNFMVMEASARGGFAAAWSVVLGVVLGSLLLLALIVAGVARAMQMFPVIGTVLSVGGGAYLAWLGASLFLRHQRDGEVQRSATPASVLGVASFQLLNPKAWLLTTTAAAAMTGNGGVFTLAALTVVVTSICLSIWALAGRASSRLLQPGRLWFDRTMGGLLALSAVGIVVDALAR